MFLKKVGGRSGLSRRVQLAGRRGLEFLAVVSTNMTEYNCIVQAFLGIKIEAECSHETPADSTGLNSVSLQ